MIKKSIYQSIPRQAKRLDERHTGTAEHHVDICGMNIIVEPGVYQTAGDTELMIESVGISKDQDFLEIGCGTGAISIALAQKAASGIGVDINEKAVANSRRNADMYTVTNVDFLTSNVFENIEGMFDIIICNPPYTNHPARDDIDRMFWDPEDEMKKVFFKEAKDHLKPDGRIYFGWADFADIDIGLPLKLAKENGCELVNTFTKPHKSDFTFYVFEFKRKEVE